MDPVALKIQKMIPEPNNQNLFNNFALTDPDARYSTIPTVKIDHNFTDASRLSFYWHYTVTDRVSSNDSMPSPITARRNQNVYAHVVRMNYDLCGDAYSAAPPGLRLRALPESGQLAGQRPAL